MILSPLHTSQSSKTPIQSSISSQIPSLSLSEFVESFGQSSTFPHIPSSSISLSKSKGQLSKPLTRGSLLIISWQSYKFPTVQAHIPSSSISF